MTLQQHHASLNQKTRSLRESYSSHRDQIMRLIGNARTAAMTHRDGQTSQPSRIAVLGAGNGNDFDLQSLTRQFDEVHLIDLDHQAIEFACGQPGIIQDRIHRHCPVDFASPLLQIAEQAAIDPPTAIDANWVSRLRQPTSSLSIPPCDVVISVGLLSQLMLTIDRAFSHLSPQTVLPMIQAVRGEHFRRTLALLRSNSIRQPTVNRPSIPDSSHGRPAGVAVFGFDFVSTDSAPEISGTPDDQLESVAVGLINQKNFFSGMNPGILMNELKSIPTVRMIGVQGPWRWHMGSRQYLMMATLVQHCGAASPLAT
jgi:hypothetical protein